MSDASCSVLPTRECNEPVKMPVKQHSPVMAGSQPMGLFLLDWHLVTGSLHSRVGRTEQEASDMAHGSRWRAGRGRTGSRGWRALLGAWLVAGACGTCGVMAQTAQTMQPSPGVPMADLPPSVVSAPLPDVGSMASRVLACTARSEEHTSEL